ncbi:MAG: hypothetical protein PHO09_11665 [Sphaerochaeta sp.]|nr:hypothetical protein [Sphaerochaeta sp.]
MTAEQMLVEKTKISIYQKADLIWSTADILVGAMDDLRWFGIGIYHRYNYHYV